MQPPNAICLYLFILTETELLVMFGKGDDMPRIKSKAASLIDSYTGNAYQPPQTPFIGKSGTHKTRLGVVSAHPGWGKFFKRYPDIAAWVKSHPGQNAGRLLCQPSGKITYYSSAYGQGRTKFNWTFGPAPNYLPKFTTYTSFADWMQPQNAKNKI
jgi:hypothetical protein